jgi:nucleoside 2-deoxyribosyltransferase
LIAKAGTSKRMPKAITRIFISYSHKDRSFVRELAAVLGERLSDAEIRYDANIASGESFVKTLTHQIERSDVILAVVSPDYLASDWALEEINLAILRRVKDEARLIPIIARPCSPVGFLTHLKPIDFTGDYEKAVTKLIWAITDFRPPGMEGVKPGSTVGTLAPNEIAKLRKELENAVQLFRSGKESSSESKQAEQRRRPECFVVMPFNDKRLEEVYEYFVKPAIEKAFECKRGDDFFGSNIIMDDILQSIQSANAVVADLTGRNANVFYEVGICHALGKSVLLLAQSLDDVPFDLRHRRVQIYDDSPKGLRALESALVNHLLAIAGHNG